MLSSVFIIQRITKHFIIEKTVSCAKCALVCMYVFIYFSVSLNML